MQCILINYSEIITVLYSEKICMSHRILLFCYRLFFASSSREKIMFIMLNVPQGCTNDEMRMNNVGWMES